MDKFLDSIKNLETALARFKKKPKDKFFFAGLSKSFETCLEYAWKFFKQKSQDEGFEVYSPREAIKYAGQLNLISDVDLWLGFLKDRNLAVHDYLGLSDSEYLKTIKKFYAEVKLLKIKSH